MPDLHYEDPLLAELYDIDGGWSDDRRFYLSIAGSRPKTILDLGCGTGLICDAYAGQGHRVTGVDPAKAMLDVARRKPNGQRVEWVQTFGEKFHSPKRFDLIIMTGHTFQVFLDQAQILAIFSVAREHLAHGGAFVFESRNPAIDWKSRWDGGEATFLLHGKSVLQHRRVTLVEPNKIGFETSYAVENATLISKSELAFWERAEIEQLLAASGLKVQDLFGNWDGSAFDERASDEMIFICGAAAPATVL